MKSATINAKEKAQILRKASGVVLGQLLTITIMNEHDCTAKGCHYFERFEDYPYWQRLRRKEELKELENSHSFATEYSEK